MEWIRVVRAVGGLLSLVTLLVMFLGDMFTRRSIDPTHMSILIMIIGSLLGLSILGKKLPISVQFGEDEGDR